MNGNSSRDNILISQEECVQLQEEKADSELSTSKRQAEGWRPVNEGAGAVSARQSRVTGSREDTISTAAPRAHLQLRGTQGAAGKGREQRPCRA